MLPRSPLVFLEELAAAAVEAEADRSTTEYIPSQIRSDDDDDAASDAVSASSLFERPQDFDPFSQR